MVREVIWPPRAQGQLAKVYAYILKHSYQCAEKVKKDVLTSSSKIFQNPERHLPDKYRLKNDGSIRAYELHGFRIAYRITEKQIIIVRVRYTAMQPWHY